jgi:Radical SAM superfamily/Iron-sulfur cluster-binding domain
MRTRDFVADRHEWADVTERNVLVLNYTMTCPASCNFCCYGCHPGRKEKMPLDQAKSLISQAASISSISSVGFTGGEVFWYEDELLELSEHLRWVGLPFTVATSGHWGRDATRAEVLATRLVRNGLRRANLSCDDAHAKYVPATSVTNAALAFAKHNIPVYIVGTFEDPVSKLEDLVPDLVGVPFVRLITKQVARVGRARKWERTDSFVRDERLTCYRRVNHDIVVFWDGKTYPCCSTFNRSTKGLSVGNAFEEPLAAIVVRVENSLLFRILKRQGFPRLYELVRRYRPAQAANLPAFEKYDGACSLCNGIFSDSETMQIVVDTIAAYEEEELEQVINRATSVLGEEAVAVLLKEISVAAAQGRSNHDGC